MIFSIIASLFYELVSFAVSVGAGEFALSVDQSKPFLLAA